MTQEPIRVLVVEARFYDDLADELLRGAKATLAAAGAEIEVISVPGALEIPAVIAMADEGGRRAGGRAFDGYVALGTVIRGETYHFEVVSNESARAIMDLTVQRRLPIGNGVLTTENGEQAWTRARVGEGNKGGGAAEACLRMIEVHRRLQGHGR